VVDWLQFSAYLSCVKLRLSLSLLLAAAGAFAQESPYFITYDHHMEEPRRLEIALTPIAGTPKEGNRFRSTTLELEYAPKGWWTSELYLDAQTTQNEGSLYTGWALENRFRLLMDEHAINPVLYIEYADTNGADKALREVVGFDSWKDFSTPNGEARLEREKELETKLILSGYLRGWNISGNAIAEKNLDGPPWEFGYALGASRPLTLAASPNPCTFCAENFSAGIEAYGGVGEKGNITLSGTSHYLAPTLGWTLPNGVSLRASPTFGLTSESMRFLMRFGISYEFSVTR